MFWASVWTQISSGQSWHGEVCNRAKNGDLYWVDSVIVPFKNDDNEIDKYVSIRIDITESKNNAAAIMRANAATKEALEELRIIEERNAFALDGSGDGVWDWDIKKNKVMLSKRWKAMIGHEENEIGDDLSEWSSRLHPDDAANVMADVQSNLDGKTPSFANQHRVLCKDGSYLWILDRGQVVARDEYGNALRMIGTHTDISKQKEMERIKSEFISTVSHELRTPITSIRGALGLIESGILGEIAPKAMELVKIANLNSQRLITLVNDILDMDKLLSGKMPLHIDVIDIKQSVIDAIAANTSYANLFEVHLQFQPSSDSFKAKADYSRLMQVFTNLLSNAAKFSNKGGVVELRINKEDKWIVIEVEDHGEGIPNDFQCKVFEAFAQADSGDTRKQGSTGLGLNISKKFIDAMDGEIGFSSKVKVGTTFWIKLPLYKEPHKEADGDK
jgi:PAS domain S-box-containing protein